MAIHLSSSVAALPGVGTNAAKDFRNMGIVSVRDLLFSVPFRYDDFSQIKKISQVRLGETVTVEGTIVSIVSRSSKTRRITVVEAVLEDETGSMPITWFNQEYLMRAIKPGMKLSVAGALDYRFKKSMVNPMHEPAGRRILTGRLVPVYRLSGSLKMHRVRTAVSYAFAALSELEDWLPECIRTAEGMLHLVHAVRSIHTPESKTDLEQAIQRLKFDELFLHQLMFAHVRKERKITPAIPMEVRDTILKAFVDSLPFSLTQSQRRAAWEIVQDLSQAHPMNRLLQGDVGSGKTVVAAIAVAQALHDRQLVVYLAPTELLCAQQHAVFMKWFPQESIALFTRSQKNINTEAVKKQDILDRIHAGEVRCVIGTHALMQESVSLPDVAFVIVDEQHRFGVAQRHALLKKTTQTSPHLLSMTATPIPRSLALTIFGDLAISTLRQMPQGRRPIGTAVVLESQRSEMWKHIKKEVEQGHQVYVVCPLIDPSDVLGTKSVKEIAVLLNKEALKGLRIEVVHGKMKSDEKQATLEAFRKRTIDVLIATTVVEVGVDVPNATVMVIMGAERFGLAQLHQLRGRIGRSNVDSFCYLLPDNAFGPAVERLKLVERIQDGFVLAEEDLKLRGSGNVFGTAQSGFPDFKLATEADVDMMKKAHDHAVSFLQKDPDVSGHPLLQEQIAQAFDRVHLE